MRMEHRSPQPPGSPCSAKYLYSKSPHGEMGSRDERVPRKCWPASLPIQQGQQETRGFPLTSTSAPWCAHTHTNIRTHAQTHRHIGHTFIPHLYKTPAKLNANHIPLSKLQDKQNAGRASVVTQMSSPCSGGKRLEDWELLVSRAI